MTQHLQLTNLKISDNLVNTISNINWQSLTPVFKVSPWFYFCHVLQHCYQHKIMPWHFLSNGSVGTLLTYKFPETIENAIKQELYASIYNMKEQPIIRLQVIYGGRHIAVHTDPTRSVSLVYPISNHNYAKTTFYKGPSTLGVINPADCVLDDYVIIDKHPVMFEVSKPHSVNYPAGTLTKQQPRISLSIKWQHSTFDQIAKHF